MKSHAGEGMVSSLQVCGQRAFGMSILEMKDAQENRVLYPQDVEGNWFDHDVEASQKDGG